jgi:hypothetical protein
LKSKFTVLFFWDYTCSHCKATIQELFTYWEELKEKNMDVQVITIQNVLGESISDLKKNKGKWIDFINEKELFGSGWINAWSPYHHKYRDLYYSAGVPVIYILDDKFNIIIRNIPIETLKEFFNNQIEAQ